MPERMAFAYSVIWGHGHISMMAIRKSRRRYLARRFALSLNVALVVSAENAEEAFHQGMDPLIADGIKDGLAFAPAFYQLVSSQYRQVLGNNALSQAERFGKVIDGALFLNHLAKKQQSILASHRLEQRNRIIGAFLHGLYVKGGLLAVMRAFLGGRFHNTSTGILR
jgi:hypothetical protein